MESHDGHLHTGEPEEPVAARPKMMEPTKQQNTDAGLSQVEGLEAHESVASASLCQKAEGTAEQSPEATAAKDTSAPADQMELFKLGKLAPSFPFSLHLCYKPIAWCHPQLR